MVGDFAYTGVTTKTAEHYLVDTGAVYKNLVLGTDGIYTSGDLLGATSGGNEFKVEQKFRTRKLDGIKEHTKGNLVLVEEIPTLKVNLKEITVQNLSVALAGSMVDTSTSTVYDIIKSKGKIELTDYLTNVGLVGRCSGSNKPIIIIIKNVLSVEGLNIKTEVEDDATIPVLLTGYYDETQVAPYEIYRPKESIGA